MIIKQKSPARRTWPWQKTQNAGAPTSKPQQQSSKSAVKPALQRSAKAQAQQVKKAEKEAQPPAEPSVQSDRGLAQGPGIADQSHARTISRPKSKNGGTRNLRRPWEKTFFETLRRCANLTVSARAAGVNPDTVYERRKLHPDFEARVQHALREAVDLLEASAWGRATQGIERGVWSKNRHGDPIKVETVREYSDRLHEVLLRAHRPEKYSPKVQAELSGPNGGQLFAPVVAPTQVQIIIPDNGRGSIEVQASSSPVQIAPALPPAQLPPPEPEQTPQPAPVETEEQRKARVDAFVTAQRNARALENIRATHPEPPPPVEPFSGGTL